MKFIDYSRDYLRFKQEYDQAWESVNMRGDLILRKDVEEFENKLAEFVGTKYAVALSSGTDAIILSLKALGAQGQIVSLPSHTFKATCGAVINAGATPMVLDLNSHSSTQFQIVVHIAGKLSLVPETSVFTVIEDACQALGAVKNPTSKTQCWSFYPAKILGCKGDAGAVTTNDSGIYEYIKGARNHFKAYNEGFGGNYRMDNLQAALLNVKFKYINEILERRQEIADKYLKELDGVVELPENSKGRVWQDFVIKTDKRDELYDYLKSKDIETMKNEYPFSPEYPKPPLALDYESKTLRIPCYENLENEEQSYVIENIKDFFLHN